MSDATITKADIMREVERAKLACPTCHRKYDYQFAAEMYQAKTIAGLDHIADLEAQLAEAANMLHHAARWFENYARAHERKAKEASGSEQHERLMKATTNQERCDAIRATLSKIGGNHDG